MIDLKNMETILDKEPVKRVKKAITTFDSNLKIIVLNSALEKYS